MIAVSTIDVRKHLGDILNRVSLRNDEYLVERKGKPLAVLMPVWKAEGLRENAKKKLLHILESLPASGLSESEALQLADEAKHAVRKK